MKILIVDDEPLIRRSLARAFRSRGHDILEAEDGRAGALLWKQHRPEAVFLDVLMPGLTGPQVLDEVSLDLRQGCFVVLMSAYSGEQSLPELNERGVHMFISKPFEDVFQLVKVVEEKAQHG